MCDYSLHNVASRPAKVGDKLVSTRFPNSITGGFCEVAKPDVAVCLLPGTELAFENKVVHEKSYGLIFPRSETVTSDQAVARFTQINLDQPHAHHDALEFPDGQIVLVTILREGQRATVIQMPAEKSKQGIEGTVLEGDAGTFGEGWNVGTEGNGGAPARQPEPVRGPDRS